jgi:hypothetical protein
MGKKPVVGLAGLVLASMALSGCWNCCQKGVCNGKSCPAPAGTGYHPGTTFSNATSKPTGQPQGMAASPTLPGQPTAWQHQPAGMTPPAPGIVQDPMQPGGLPMQSYPTPPSPPVTTMRPPVEVPLSSRMPPPPAGEEVWTTGGTGAAPTPTIQPPPPPPQIPAPPAPPQNWGTGSDQGLPPPPVGGVTTLAPPPPWSGRGSGVTPSQPTLPPPPPNNVHIDYQP